MDKKPFIIAAIPAFNEERTIARVILSAKRHVDKVIVCDDGSTDVTGEIAESMGADVVRHSLNMGKGKSLRKLFSRAFELNPDVVVTFDADGQHDPNQIPILVKPIIDGNADMAIGSRFIKGSISDMPAYRRIGLRFVNWFCRRATNSKIRDTQSGFIAYSLKALNIVSSSVSTGYSIDAENLALAAKKGLRIMEVPITVKYNLPNPTSKKAPLPQGFEIVSSTLKLVVEERPLIFFGLPGFLFILVGTFFGVWMLQVYTVDHYIVTNIALASIGFILIGVFAVFTAITLYAIARLVQKMNSK